MADTNPLPRIIGHRGACGLAPENTRASFWAAATADVRWIEFDVQLTADGVPVVIHDETLDRTTNGKGPVCAATWAEIKKLDAGSWFGIGYVGLGVPSFSQVMAELGTFGLGANVEIKPAPGAEDETARAVVDAIAAEWPVHLSRPLLSSFSSEVMGVLQEIAPALDRAALFPAEAASDVQACIDTALGLGCSALHVGETAADATFATAAHDAGLWLRAYTVNDPTRADALFAAGIDGIFTDYPDRMTAFLG